MRISGTARLRQERSKARPSSGRRNADGYRIGAWHGKAVEPNEQVLAVLADYKIGERGRGYAATAKKHGLPTSTVRDWCTFRTRADA